MVIIRINADISAEYFAAFDKGIRAQAETGIILLPYCCEVLAVTDDSTGLQITQGKEDPRVEHLEKELSAAMKYITAQRACVTCKRFDQAALVCENVCSECEKEDCFCRTCSNGDKWEWRGACEPV